MAPSAGLGAFLVFMVMQKGAGTQLCRLMKLDFTIQVDVDLTRTTENPHHLHKSEAGGSFRGSTEMARVSRASDYFVGERKSERGESDYDRFAGVDVSTDNHTSDILSIPYGHQSGKYEGSECKTSNKNEYGDPGENENSGQDFKGLSDMTELELLKKIIGSTDIGSRRSALF